MHRSFIATTLAVALAATTFGAGPARADQDALRALAALAGVAVVGKIIHDQSKRNTDQKYVVDDRFKAHGFRREAERYKPRHTQRGHKVKPGLHRQHKNLRLLPGDCLRSVDTRRGAVRYFSERCLERTYRHVEKLPRGCAVRIRGYDGTRAGYEARCLRNQGYQLARR